MNYALIIAGGSGNRMGQDIPKQFMHVDNCPIIIHTMMAFQKHPDIQGIAVVCLAGWETVLQSYANQFCITKLKWIFPGGSNGQESIHNGIYGLKEAGCGDDDSTYSRQYDSAKPTNKQEDIQLKAVVLLLSCRIMTLLFSFAPYNLLKMVARNRAAPYEFIRKQRATIIGKPYNVCQMPLEVSCFCWTSDTVNKPSLYIDLITAWSFMAVT